MVRPFLAAAGLLLVLGGNFGCGGDDSTSPVEDRAFTITQGICSSFGPDQLAAATDASGRDQIYRQVARRTLASSALYYET
jgi:hypothetical protein